MVPVELSVSEQLHRLIDSQAAQPVINERVAGLIERLIQVGTDHEKRVRYVERVIGWALGAAGMISTGVMLWSKLK
jgi:hypothetical protein